MKDKKIKEKIDTELSMINVNEKMKQNIEKSLVKRNQHKMLKTVAATLVFLMLGGTTVAAGYYIVNKIRVNDEMLTELDEMRVIDIKKMEQPKDELGTIEQDFKDYAVITMNNYIIGDTANFRYLEEKDRYEYEHGKTYYSPVSLNIDLILSDEQLKNGWDADYLGMYESMEEYQSAQGYKVNLIQDNNGDKKLNEGIVSEKIAIFVSDGIRYTLKGRVSIDTMKTIVDTMK